jgi:CBS domain-containing protein
VANEEVDVKVSEVLRSKGDRVETVEPGAMLELAVHRLSRQGIGSLVVCDGDGHLVGLLAEREVVVAMARHGAAAGSHRVAEVMHRQVASCSPDTGLDEALAVMTRSRQRHLPVVADGRVVGLVSIGDVVKHRLDEMLLEAHVLRERLISSR